MLPAYDADQMPLAIANRSHWGRIRVSDADRLRFLHNQTTNAFQQLQPGQGCETVFVTSTARTLDLVTAYVETESVLLLTSPGLQTQLMEWMDRYIFFADKVKLTDVTDETFTYTLLGPGSETAMQTLGMADVVDLSPNHHQPGEIAGVPVLVATGTGLALPGYTLIGPQAEATQVWQAFTDLQALPLEAETWEYLRIQQGRPMPGHELTEDDNPLEAGLWQTISFDKGCYIGQETIARLNTYQGVKKQLWGLKLSAPVPRGTVLSLGDEKIGKVTSVVETPAGILGLGYLRTKAGGAGLTVQAGEAHAEVVDIPFLVRGYLDKK
jgi:folate-binding protein YgfZ